MNTICLDSSNVFTLWDWPFVKQIKYKLEFRLDFSEVLNIL